jgi:hypothetical protein
MEVPTPIHTPYPFEADLPVIEKHSVMMGGWWSSTWRIDVRGRKLGAAQDWIESYLIITTSAFYVRFKIHLVTIWAFPFFLTSPLVDQLQDDESGGAPNRPMSTSFYFSIPRKAQNFRPLHPSWTVITAPFSFPRLRWSKVSHPPSEYKYFSLKIWNDSLSIF